MRRALLAALASGALIAAGCGHQVGVATGPATVASATSASAPSASVPVPASAPPASVPQASAPSASGPDPTPTAPASAGAAGAGPSSAPAPGSPAPAHPVPAAFRPAPGAPSDAEVRRELAQLMRIERAARALEQLRSQLSPVAPSAATLLPWSLEIKSGVRASVASVFTDYGLGLACGGLLGRSQLGVAHKTAPCGTLITFYYGGRALTVPVIDRGPYIAGREWDLTGATAAALGFPGLSQIQWSVSGG